MVFPIYHPTNLELLVQGANIIITGIEENSTEKLIEDKFLQEDIHKYQKLLDFLEEGYVTLKKEPDSFKALDKSCLFNDYLLVVSLGMLMLQHDTIKFCGHLKHPAKLNTEDLFYENYFQEVKRLWEDITKIQPSHKEKIELMKHFNEVTRFIGANRFHQDGDLIHDIVFDYKKDTWKISCGRMIYH